jgi:hypothetical protein
MFFFGALTSTVQPTNQQPAIYPIPGGSIDFQMPPLAIWLICIAHEVVSMIYRLKEGNSTKWLFSSSLAARFGSPITPEQKAATGLVKAPPVWELTDFLPQNTPKSTKTAICRIALKVLYMLVRI